MNVWKARAAEAQWASEAAEGGGYAWWPSWSNEVRHAVRSEYGNPFRKSEFSLCGITTVPVPDPQAEPSTARKCQLCLRNKVFRRK